MDFVKSLNDLLYPQEERVDESNGPIYDYKLRDAIVEIAQTMYPDVGSFTFARKHPVLFLKDGWRVGKMKVDRRELNDRFNSNELTEEEIKEIIENCMQSETLTVSKTPQYDWDSYFEGYREESMKRDGLDPEEYISQNSNFFEDVPIVARDSIDAEKRKRLAEIKRAKEYRAATAEKDDMISFSINSIRKTMERLGIIKNGTYGYFPGEPYLVPKEGIIKLRKRNGKPDTPANESNRWYKWTKIDVFRDPERPKGTYADKPRRWEAISGYMCSKKDLEDACRKIGEMDWMDIKDYPYKRK